MKLYNSYIKKSSKGDIRDLIFIQNGFSFLAFFFNFLWFAYHKMIKAVIIVFLIDLTLIKLIGLYKPSAFDTLVIIIGSSLMMAANANYFHARYLKNKGYEFIGCVFGSNKESAKLRFVEGYIEEYDDKTIKRYKFLNKKDRPNRIFKKEQNV